MRRFVSVFVFVVAACGGPAADTTTTSVVDTTTTSPESTTTTVVPVLDDCPPAPYRVPVLPARVDEVAVPSEEIELDPVTSAPGTHSTIWLDGEGDLAVALVRGTLPLEDFPGDKGEVFIDGARGVAGPFPDGSWVVAWFEAPGERCDLYTMVFYPPVEPLEVRDTIEAMDRVAG
ncbi:MAG: hypothetical protein R6X29_06300 [Acidimicrobiia bacterium]|jgi:hypothetical protein